MNQDTPPQDRAYDEVEKLQLVLGDVGAQLTSAFRALGAHLTAFAEGVRDAYEAKLDEKDDDNEGECD